MSRFLNGFNRDIANLVKFYYYFKIEDMMHIAIKVEKQLKRKSSARPGGYLWSSQAWKFNFRREGIQIKSITVPKVI